MWGYSLQPAPCPSRDRRMTRRLHHHRCTRTPPASIGDDLHLKHKYVLRPLAQLPCYAELCRRNGGQFTNLQEQSNISVLGFYRRMLRLRRDLSRRLPLSTSEDALPNFDKGPNVTRAFNLSRACWTARLNRPGGVLVGENWQGAEIGLELGPLGFTILDMALPT